MCPCVEAAIVTVDGAVHSARRAGRRKSQCAASAVLAALAVALAGLAAWQVSHPAYREVTLQIGGPSGPHVRVAYPVSWRAREISDSITHSPSGANAIDLIELEPAASGGLQTWIEEHVLHTYSRVPADTRLEILLQPIATVRSIDNETERYRTIMQQMDGLNAAYSIQKSSRTAGDVLDVEWRMGGPLTDVDNALIVIPTLRSPRVAYEIVVRYRTTEMLHARMRRIALDVVSRLRVVQQK